MRHKCTVCENIYDSSADILNGCSCGNKLFYFVKNKSKDKEKSNNNSDTEYFYEIEDEENNELIVLDTESVNIISNGKYEIDIQSLMNEGKAVTPVYKYGEGKYSIDINVSNIRKRRK